MSRPQTAKNDAEQDMLAKVAVRAYERDAGHFVARAFGTEDHVGRRYMRGKCAAFAVAMRRATRLPLWAMYDPADGHLHHVFAFDPYDLAAIDVRGGIPLEQVADGSALAGAATITPLVPGDVEKYLGNPTRGEIEQAAAVLHPLLRIDDGPGGLQRFAAARGLPGKTDWNGAAGEIAEIIETGLAAGIELAASHDAGSIHVSDITRTKGPPGAGRKVLDRLIALAERRAMTIGLHAMHSAPDGKLVAYYEKAGFRLTGDCDGGENPGLEYVSAAARLARAPRDARTFSSLLDAERIVLHPQLRVTEPGFEYPPQAAVMHP